MDSRKPYDVIYKMVLLGNFGVGKTSLLCYFNDRTIPYPLTTLGVDFMIKIIDLDGNRVKLQMWDLAGGERMRYAPPSHLRGTAGSLLVFDVTDRETFDNVPRWFDHIQDKIIDGLQVILVGNKCDRQADRQVDYHSAKELAESFGVTYIETSAKEGYNVEQAFIHLAALTFRHGKPAPVKQPMTKQS